LRIGCFHWNSAIYCKRMGLWRSYGSLAQREGGRHGVGGHEIRIVIAGGGRGELGPALPIL
jgi:hypothetical protein